MLILFAIVFIDLVGFGIIIPMLPFYGERYGASPDEVAFLMAVYSLAQFITAPFWGRLSDRVGRKPVLLISLAGTVVGYVWLAMADDLVHLFMARALGGAMAGSIAAAFAYAADITTRENRAKGMGVIGAAFGLGFVAGPAIGGILGGHDPAHTDFSLPAYVAAAFSLAAFLCALFVLKESLSPEIRAQVAKTPREGRWRTFLATMHQPNLRLTILLNFMAVCVIGGVEATFALWSERRLGWGIAQNGYLFAYMGIVIAIMQGSLAGPLARRIGETGMVRFGFAGLAAGLVLIPISPNLPVLIVAMTIVSVGFSMTTPGLNSLMSLQAGPDQQGAIMGVGRSAAILARVAGPAAAGILFEAVGRDWPFFAGAAVMALVLIIAISGLRQPRKAV